MDDKRIWPIWEKIKNHWRKEFGQSEIYSDEEEHVIGFEANDTTVIIIGYLHFQSSLISSEDYIDFINYLKESASNYKTFKVYLLSNYKLHKIKTASKIRGLPSDVSYYFIHENILDEGVSVEQDSPVKAAEFCELWNKPKRKVQSDSWDDPFSERSIMRDLENGEGEKHGFD